MVGEFMEQSDVMGVQPQTHFWKQYSLIFENAIFGHEDNDYLYYYPNGPNLPIISIKKSGTYMMKLFMRAKFIKKGNYCMGTRIVSAKLHGLSAEIVWRYDSNTNITIDDHNINQVVQLPIITLIFDAVPWKTYYSPLYYLVPAFTLTTDEHIYFFENYIDVYSVNTSYIITRVNDISN